MKRSDAIQEIENYLMMILGGDHLDGIDLSKNLAQMLNEKTRIATELLDVVEGVVGMEPPPHQERRGTGHADEYGMEETRIEWVQGWEAE